MLRVFIWILGLSALLGNLFVVIWRLKSTEPLRVQAYLILNLAISDCLMGVYMITIASADMHFRDRYIYNAYNWTNGLLCGFVGFLAAFSSEVSVYILTVISMDRFICIMFPFSQKKLGTTSVRYVIAAGWVLSFILSSIPAMPFISYFGSGFYGRSSVCLALPLTRTRTPGWEYSVMIFLVLNMLAFLTILICYACIFVVVKRSSSQIRSSSNKGMTNEITLATKTILIIATDMFCWVPIAVLGILSQTGVVELPSSVYAWIAVFVLPINSSVNPYLYTISSIKLKDRISELSNSLNNKCPHCKVNGGSDSFPMVSFNGPKGKQTLSSSYLTRKYS